MAEKYPISDEEKSVLRRNFTYHAPTDDQVERYKEIRKAAHFFALVVAKRTPGSADRTLALRRIREAVMYANASIAINEDEIKAADE